MYMYMLLKRDTILPTCTVLLYYCIAKKFGGKLNLAVWQSACATTKLKSANIKKFFWRIDMNACIQHTCTPFMYFSRIRRMPNHQNHLVYNS